jgi:hypothetical protein
MHAPPHTIIITSCTNRKKKTGGVVSLYASDAVTSVESLAQTWASRVNAAPHREPVRTLYQGRAFSEAKLAASAAGASLYVASAGHGLVDSESSLPSYDLTVAAAPGNQLHLILDRLQKSSADWWHALTTSFEYSRSLANFFDNHASQNCVVLLAMPSSYITMLRDDFARLNCHQASQLRIITSEFGASKLPDQIRKMALPYDERLDGCQTYAGTRTDFAQRALRHFVVELRGHELPLNVAREKVISAMQALAKPHPPQRERKSDDAIEDLIFQNWNHHRGSQSALLRWLRDQQLVSCEQGRFRVLWQRVKSKIAGTGRGNNG